MLAITWQADTNTIVRMRRVGAFQPQKSLILQYGGGDDRWTDITICSVYTDTNVAIALCPMQPRSVCVMQLESWPISVFQYRCNNEFLSIIDNNIYQVWYTGDIVNY